MKSNIPKLSHLIISALVIANAFFICYAVGLNLRTKKLDSGTAEKARNIKASSYTAKDVDTKDSSAETGSSDKSKTGSMADGVSGSQTAKDYMKAGSAGTTGSTSDTGSVADTTSSGTVTTSKSFKDLEKTEERLVPSLKAAADAGVLDKTEDKMFYPNKPVTRADFTRWMVRIKQLPINSSDTASYLDVDASNPYYKEIETATAANMVQGYPIKGSEDKNFKPDQFISREEFAALYGTFSGKRARAERLDAAKIDEYLQYDPDHSNQAKFGYKDEGQIDDWARKWVAVAQQASVIQQAFDCNPGSTKEEKRFLHPHQRMTRAESVNILVKLFGLSAGKTVKEGGSAK